ncbi:MAG TPA: hypothetical protein RMH85_07250 [Polyangiaceae bacterium LLY-WYZ-15_(1-7)]|nr:hypothetical protein [Sandaracinus sp.]HJL00260.1 hypothetical protein [Polyangiaceae bacterium LLY-WYZ-15_(1-7)]HJL08275.1 hypothetical protein [Polyangiaceae bacterium LLY-WYZ-15_(1-7)]HJL35709.1 hypothetical protein [Polyangiaceae bacterium LLY-WYZ-15_(1-7)]
MTDADSPQPPAAPAETLPATDLEALRAAHAARPPTTPRERLRWALRFVEAGDLETARALRAALPADDAARLDRALLADAPGAPTEEDAAEAEADALDLRRAPLERPDTALARLFLQWFGGRPDLYARQWHDRRRRRSGYRPVREPFTEQVALDHLAGRHTVGQYPLFPDGTVSFAAFDLDLSASALAELEAGHGPGSPVRHPVLRAYAARLLEAGARLGLPLFPEDSGGKGLHLWLFFAPRRPARAARQLLRHLLEVAGAPPADVSLELFPKQDAPGRRGLSSLIKLPLGLHQATLRRCPLLTDGFEPIESPEAALRRLRPVDPPQADAILGRRMLSLPLPSARSEAAPAPPAASTPRSLASALRALGEGPDARGAADRVLARCAQLRALVDRAYAERHLDAPEARALIYSLGLLGPEPTTARDALVAAGVPMRELHRVRRGLPSPVGCKRLRALGGDARCRGCAMRHRDAQPYPTPALFAVEAPRGEPRHAAFAPWLGQAELGPEPVEELGDAVRALDARLRRLEGGDDPAAAPPGDGPAPTASADGAADGASEPTP